MSQTHVTTKAMQMFLVWAATGNVQNWSHPSPLIMGGLALEV